MKNTVALGLKQYDKLTHSRYGVCEVFEVLLTSERSLFGVDIRPLTEAGKKSLAADTGGDILNYLEADVRKLNWRTL